MWSIILNAVSLTSLLGLQKYRKRTQKSSRTFWEVPVFQFFFGKLVNTRVVARRRTKIASETPEETELRKAKHRIHQARYRNENKAKIRIEAFYAR